MAHATGADVLLAEMDRRIRAAATAAEAKDPLRRACGKCELRKLRDLRSQMVRWMQPTAANRSALKAV